MKKSKVTLVADECGYECGYDVYVCVVVCAHQDPAGTLRARQSVCRLNRHIHIYIIYIIHMCVLFMCESYIYMYV